MICLAWSAIPHQGHKTHSSEPSGQAGVLPEPLAVFLTFVSKDLPSINGFFVTNYCLLSGLFILYSPSINGTFGLMATKATQSSCWRPRSIVSSNHFAPRRGFARKKVWCWRLDSCLTPSTWPFCRRIGEPDETCPTKRRSTRERNLKRAGAITPHWHRFGAQR